MTRILLIAACLWAPRGAQALDSEWHVTLITALELPGLESQSPTDFDLATYATGLQVSHGLTDGLQVGGRIVFSQVSGTITDYTSRDAIGTQFTGDLDVDLTAWRTEALLRLQLLHGYDLKPRLLIAGGYTWTVYGEPLLTAADFTVPVSSDDFAQGTWTVSGGLDIAYRIFSLVELSVGIEASHFFEGHYTSALRIPLNISGVFWSPI